MLKAMVSEGTEPQINTDKHRLNALSEQIIGAAFEVSNVLGTGFLEKVYENALNIELNLRGLQTFQQAPLKVFYKDELVGDYIADILVENEIIIEVKAVKESLMVSNSNETNLWFICVHLRLKNSKRQNSLFSET